MKEKPTDLPPEVNPLPPINLRHLFVLTDGTGILQHAAHGTPDPHHGYCTDDNARALIAAVKLWALPEELWAGEGAGSAGPDELLIAMQRYLAFLVYAFNPEPGRFRNFMQYDRSWLEEIGSEDSHARTVWALGTAYHLAPNEDVRNLADRLMRDALVAAADFEYLRPCAYTLLGLDEYLRGGGANDLADRLYKRLGERLYELWKGHAQPDWPWWEDFLTWGNAKLPHAMLVAGLALGSSEIVQAALAALRWLLEVQTGPAGQLSIIGNRGWYYRGGRKAQFDQQPIEAKALVQACVTAGRATGEACWISQAMRCFRWFTGENDKGLPLYNSDTGGGYDGLGPDGVNANQGAESTLAYLLSLLELYHYNQLREGQRTQ